MIAATLRTRPAAGLRRVSLTRDLGAIADLIEICFSASMDASGRATVREMRALSSLGPALGLLSLSDSMLKGIGQGFVWEEEGRIVGNVTLFPLDFPAELGRTVAIANVAVHPDYQRRGIARRLMDASLDALRTAGVRAAILQVEHANSTARHLYERLGFHLERTWHQWRRGGNQPLPRRVTAAPHITLRPANRWREEYALAAQVFPAAQGGLGWQRPLHPREFTRSPWKAVLDFLSGTTIERWIVREERQIAAALWARTSFANSTIQLTLLVHPSRQSELEDPLINYALRRLGGDFRAMGCEHPADDLTANAVFERYGFQARRTLDHMRLEL